MQGLAAGLAAIADRAGAAFVSSTDMPFLHPAFVRRVLRAVAEGADVGLPVARGYPQPLAAAYRTKLAATQSGSWRPAGCGLPSCSRSAWCPGWTRRP